MRRALLGLLICLPPLSADELAIRGLVHNLGHDKHRIRETAKQKLLALGTQALPALEQALSAKDLQVRRQARVLTEKIKIKDALAPKLITLEVKKKTLKEILTLITQQTGYQFTYFNNDATEISIRLHREPFWKAMRKICHAAGVILQPSYADTTIRLTRADGFAPLVQHRGLFRFAPSSISEHRSLSLELVGGRNGMVRQQMLSFSFYVFTEPKLPILSHGQAVVTEAVDSKGYSMINRKPNRLFLPSAQSRFGTGYQSLAVQSSGTLRRPSEKATHIRFIRGTIPLTLLMEKRARQVTDSLLDTKKIKAQLGSTSFELHPCKDQGKGQYQLRLRVTNRDMVGSLDYSWLNSLYRRLQVTDAEGRAYQNCGNNWIESSVHSVDMTISFSRSDSKTGKPSCLYYHDWQTKQIDIPFELRDIPLP